MSSNLASALILSTFNLASKAFLRGASKDLRVEGLETLLAALQEIPPPHSNGQKQVVDLKGKGREVDVPELEELRGRPGVVTICNHTSVVDDPMMWGIMPSTRFLPFVSPSYVKRNTRWTLGASDIMFTNPIFSKFFTLGQVIETVRGGGIFQPAIDEAIKKLQAGDWIHIFPEGRVNQVSLHPPGGLIPFKWGISRIIMDSARLPTIIPIWISGFEQVMPDTRKYLRFLPRPGKKISITIGDPITSKIEPLVNEWKRLAALEKRGGKSLGVGGEWSGATEKVLSGIRDAETRVSVAAALSPERRERGMGKIAEGREVLVRKHICGVLSHELAALGRGVEEREGKDKDEWRNAVRRQG